METRNVITRSKVRVRTREPELLQQILATTARFAASNQTTARRSYELPRVAPSRKSGRDVFIATVQLFGATALVISIVIAHVVRHTSAHRDPGVTDASSFVDGGAGPQTDGRLLVTTVRLPTSGDIELAAKTRMRTSQKSAIAVAKRCLGVRKASSLTIDTKGISGGSGGLVLALAAMDALSNRDSTLGRQVAGTGTIREDGTVGPVRYVEDKARNAAEAGADLFLVPEAQIAEARRGAGSMRVAGVRTFDDAVRVLTGAECAA